MNSHQTTVTLLFVVILLFRGAKTGYVQHAYTAISNAVQGRQP